MQWRQRSTPRLPAWSGSDRTVRLTLVLFLRSAVPILHGVPGDDWDDQQTIQSSARITASAIAQPLPSVARL